MKGNYIFLLIIAAVVILVIAVAGNVISVPTDEKEEKKRVRPSVPSPITAESPVAPSPSKYMSKGEEECKRVLERIYGVPFVSIQPDWLKSTETNRNLELDCYARIPLSRIDRRHNKDDITVEVACEYQGEQHYRQVKKWQATEDKFHSQVWNDDYKRKLCAIYGVHLIEVPYTVHVRAIDDFIRGELEKRSLLPVR